jgi:nitrous oxide reductase accessory protein NosL
MSPFARPSRRALLVAAFAALALGLVACKKDERCKTCGMKLDPKSAWLAEIDDGSGTPLRYDSPRCALEAYVHPKGAKLSEPRVQEFYSRAWQPAGAVKFVIGSDVLGPMGPDLIPVDPARVDKFVGDHKGRAVDLAAITPAVLTEATGG